MEVRTRRSAGVTGGPLNPAMISLLPLQRLKEELQNRGLDVRGNKDDLAMRLEDHVRLAEGGRQLYDPSPFSASRVESESPKKNKRGYKRKVDDRQPDDDIIDIENTEQLQPDIQILTNPVSVAAPPLKFNWAKEKPSIATVLSLFPKAPEPPIFHVEMPQVVTALKTNEQPSPNLLASTPPVNNTSIIPESPVIEKVTVNNAKASKNKESINQNGENQERLTIKVKRIHLENKVANQSPGFDILDSILDKQEQLLARKTATLGMGKSVAELTNENSTDDEEVNELLELELKKRKQRMDRASGLSAGTTTGNIQSSQTSLSTSTTDREDHFSFVNSISSNSPPLIVDRRDPLGLSSIGPDTPPPPPPPSRHTAMPSLSIASLLPPPPPPPPRAIPSINSPDINYTQPKANEQLTGSINPSFDIEVISSIVSDLINTVSKTVELCVENNVNKEHENHIGSDKEMGERDEYEDGELSSDEASNIEDEEYYEEQSQEDEMEEENDERSVEEEDGDEILIVDEFSQLLKDPKALLHKASDVLRRKFGTDDDAELEPRAHYEQVPPSVDELKIEEDEEYRQLPDPEQFHGEPVPDDMDDDLFEIAAGLPLRTKNKDKEPQLVIEEEPLPNEEEIELDFYNSDLNMKASTSNNWLIDPDNADGFALMWGGVRANYGIIVPEQRDDMPPLAFQVKIAELLSLKHLPFEEPDAHDIRLGWSRLGTSNMLGESPYSFAFNSMANKATGNIFADYGEPFGIGDVITAVLDINCGEIRFFKNSQTLGPAFTDIQFQTGDVFFPHVATKNCKVYVYFGNECPDNPPQSNLNTNEDNTITDEEINQWGLPPDEVPEGTKWIGKIDLRMLAPSRRPISDKAHCTIIAMVGLSGVGKTSWVRQYLKEHPEEDWVLLNNDSILQSMAVNGVPRQRVHQGRWDMVMGLTAKALNRSLQMACRRRHNYILDQTNVTRDARKRKLTQFQDFQRKCVVIIPSEAEHERRLIRQAREQGGIGQMPAEAMLEMKGNFSIPSTDQEPIEDVIFIEPPIERLNEAIEQVVRYNEEGQPWVRQQQQRFNRSRGQPQSIISDHSNIPFVGVTRIGV
uniref:Heterogeneous nuclear ribonucleoprotein U-like protein 1 n=1 Tax=Meloidogyne javanica TaxID=6303 RepID=A0A915N5N8_MELJA